MLSTILIAIKNNDKREIIFPKITEKDKQVRSGNLVFDSLVEPSMCKQN